ncbi:MAG TPA: Ku protein, partial [Dehalococcoidia bacterium]|nr:Ku protein [Dehalococcoidia bacterium]
IEAKLEGQELEDVVAPAPAKVTDLMTALKASVEAQKKKRAEAEEAEEEEARPRRRAKAAAG